MAKVIIIVPAHGRAYRLTRDGLESATHIIGATSRDWDLVEGDPDSIEYDARLGEVYNALEQLENSITLHRPK